MWARVPMEQGTMIMASPRGARSARDEFSEIRTTMSEAQALSSLGDRPLIVVTALKSAQGGWTAAQDELAALSTNSVHRELDTASHAMLTGDQSAAAESSRAINDVVASVRTSSSLAGTGAGR